MFIIWKQIGLRGVKRTVFYKIEKESQYQNHCSLLVDKSNTPQEFSYACRLYTSVANVWVIDIGLAQWDLVLISHIRCSWHADRVFMLQMNNILRKGPKDELWEQHKASRIIRFIQLNKSALVILYIYYGLNTIRTAKSWF